MTNAAFVPVVPTSSKGRSSTESFKLAVSPQPETAQQFMPSAPAPVPHATAAGHPAGPPEISLEKQGDRITCIRVRCSCGQVIELDCAY